MAHCFVAGPSSGYYFHGVEVEPLGILVQGSHHETKAVQGAAAATRDTEGVQVRRRQKGNPELPQQ